MGNRIVPAAFFALLCAATALANGHVREVSFVEAYHLALENNKAILLEEISQRKTQLSEIQARSYLLPRASAELQYTQGDREERTFGAGVTQPLYTGGKASAERRKSEHLQEAAEFSVRFTRQQVLKQLIDITADLRKAQEMVRVNQENVKRLEEHVNKSRIRLEVGEIARTALLQSQMALSEGRADYFESLSHLSTLNTRLNNIIGSTHEIRIVGELHLPELPASSFDDWLVKANLNRNDLMAEEALLEYSHDDLRARVSAYYPRLDAFVRYSIPDFEESSESIVYTGLNLSIPILEGGTRIASYREAKFNIIESSHRILQRKENVRLDVNQELNTIDVLKYKLEEASSRMDYARENLRMTTLQFEVGKSTNLDVLDAMLSLSNAERALAEAHYDMIKAQYGLLFHVGTLDISLFSP
ncbi:outer membrane efflux protein [Desulfurispirillum indicum S5]|uniref:Outer membrane efflux protein n=1 Tax=Desulfurispirillum indicum (strain ATCC BAA-1389 / DSM 22839 / S5) TaxID=653733 RepID=E6W2U7_DESIS|nr:TolC family protein [Desulfurispirillum indicum]ADU66772.1 outer membrane efflux protein [Desulfurispirillum indicum S5]